MNIDKKIDELFNLLDKNSDIKYMSTLKSYISSKALSNKTNIKRQIFKIDVKDGVISITTVEGLIKDKKLYNVLD